MNDITAMSVIEDIKLHVDAAERRYGDFASAHEALGVAIEEWDELRDAIRANAIESIRDEAIDLAAVLLRLAVQCRSHESFKRRSMK